MKTAPHLCVSALLLAASAVAAQGLYRHVDANGRVVYSDRPPAGTSQPAANPANRNPATAAATGGESAQLPYELRQVVQRYPVTLYSRSDCAPCDNGRSMLKTRGVPFSEKTVNTSHDSAALVRLAGQSTLPLLTVGSQHLKGYTDSEWSRYLDAAGYPASIALPRGYANPPAQALAPAPATPVANSADNTPPPAPRAAPAPSHNTSDNPAGIRF